MYYFDRNLVLKYEVLFYSHALTELLKKTNDPSELHKINADRL
jgi:hypothetical protein